MNANPGEKCNSQCFTDTDRPGINDAMNSFARLIVSLSALVASLSFAWLALGLTETIPGHKVTLHHLGRADFDVSLDHSGSISVEHSGLIDLSGSVEVTHHP